VGSLGERGDRERADVFVAFDITAILRAHGDRVRIRNCAAPRGPSPQPDEVHGRRPWHGRVVFRWRSERAQPGLYACPVCGARTVSVLDEDELDALHSRVVLRCAECETWRRVVVTIWGLEAYRHGLAIDRAQMQETLARLEHERMVAATQALIAALRRDLVDPADFAP
jgi:hypothetical protein